MKQKLLFLAAALTLLGAPLTSCDKDGRRGPEENLKSVNGTEWLATNATIRFADGRYTIKCNAPGWGTYKQQGNRITFSGNSVVLSAYSVTPTTGVISKYGDSMTVTFKDWSGNTETVRFTYNILAD